LEKKATKGVTREKKMSLRKKAALLSQSDAGQKKKTRENLIGVDHGITNMFGRYRKKKGVKPPHPLVSRRAQPESVTELEKKGRNASWGRGELAKTEGEKAKNYKGGGGKRETLDRRALLSKSETGNAKKGGALRNRNGEVREQGFFRGGKEKGGGEGGIGLRWGPEEKQLGRKGGKKRMVEKKLTFCGGSIPQPLLYGGDKFSESKMDSGFQ